MAARAEGRPPKCGRPPPDGQLSRSRSRHHSPAPGRCDRASRRRSREEPDAHQQRPRGRRRWRPRPSEPARSRWRAGTSGLGRSSSHRPRTRPVSGWESSAAPWGGTEPQLCTFGSISGSERARALERRVDVEAQLPQRLEVGSEPGGGDDPVERPELAAVVGPEDDSVVDGGDTRRPGSRSPGARVHCRSRLGRRCRAGPARAAGRRRRLRTSGRPRPGAAPR